MSVNGREVVLPLNTSCKDNRKYGKDGKKRLVAVPS